MKGLFYKDFSTTWDAYKKNFFLVLVIYGVMAYLMEMDFFLFAIVFLMGMYAVTSLSFDENSHWDTYSRTLPVSASQQVAGKYLLGLAWMGLGVVVALGMTLCIGLLRGEVLTEFLPPVLGGCAGAFCTAAVYNAVTYPLSYKFGAAKARSTVMLAMAGLFLGAFLIITRLLPEGWLDTLEVPQWEETTFLIVLIAGLAGVGLLAYLVSWIVSIVIYKKKEY